MTRRKSLIVFDVDGTLVDSQGDIVAAMSLAFEAAGHPAPGTSDILSIVGLSLEVAIPRLAPGLTQSTHHQMVQSYKDAYVQLREQSGVAQSSPLFPHARETLEQLNRDPDVILGVATGKSRRGLDKLLEGHDLGHFFVTQQVSDNHPSKPHPAMLLTALAETGTDVQDAVMVGDTSFDMEMARAAGICGIGVSWGYHPRSGLSSGRQIIDDFRDLAACLDRLREDAA